MWIGWLLVSLPIMGFFFNCRISQASNETTTGAIVTDTKAQESAKIFEKTMESTQLFNINRIHQNTLKCKTKIHVVVTLETDNSYWIASTITFCKVGDRKENRKRMKGESGHFVNCDTSTDRHKLTNSQDENNLKEAILELLTTRWGDFGVHCAQIFCKYLDSETAEAQKPNEGEDFPKPLDSLINSTDNSDEWRGNPTTHSCYPDWCLDLSFMNLPVICLPVIYPEVFYPPNN